MKAKAILLLVLVYVMCFLSFADDSVLLNCTETPEIRNLDVKPKNFSPSNNLKRKPGSLKRADGELIRIVGRVTDINCLPIQNAVVSIWHNNFYGVNHYEENIEHSKLDPNFAGSGRSIVNNLGYYSFITIPPGKADNRAPHINFLVQHPDFLEFKTQMFFVDNRNINYSDHILMSFIDKNLAELLIAPFIYDNNIKTYVFNITLNGHNKFSNKR